MATMWQGEYKGILTFSYYTLNSYGIQHLNVYLIKKPYLLVKVRSKIFILRPLRQFLPLQSLLRRF